MWNQYADMATLLGNCREFDFGIELSRLSTPVHVEGELATSVSAASLSSQRVLRTKSI